MQSRRDWLLALAASLAGQGGIAGQTRPNTGRPSMSPSPPGNLRLEIAARDGATGALFPEQSAEFDLFLRNTGSAAASAIKITGNFTTPAYVLFDAKGAEIGRYTVAHLMAQGGLDLGTKRPPATQMVQIPPGRASQTKFDVWGFVRPYPPGRYAVQVDHLISPGGAVISSNRLPFEIVPARVTGAAAGYDNSGRSASVLAWLASGADGAGNGRLLVRLSTPKGHTFLAAGASSHGEFPAGSRVAVAQMAAGVEEGGLGWVAVASPRQVVVIRHNLSYPFWRSPAISLPLDNPVPVPRFPDMGEDAIFLATGAAGKGGVLVGVPVNQPKGAAAPWSVPISTVPALAACMSKLKRTISVLLVDNSGSGSRISRMELTLAGKVLSPEKVVRSSANQVAGVAPGLDPASGSFLVVETPAGHPDRYSAVRIPQGGSAQAGRMETIAAWPKDHDGNPAAPQSLFVEELSETSVGIAFTVPGGAFYSGRLTPKAMLYKVRDDPASACSFPHLAALSQNITPACFTAEGRLFFAGKRAGETVER